VNERDRLIKLVNKQDGAFEEWRHGSLVDQIVTKLETENSNIRGLEALLRSAFEAGWIGGYNHATE
jgi:hypothetical protein